MRSRILPVAAVLALGMVVGMGCATTKLTGVWKSPDWQGGKLQKVLVVGMTSDPSFKGLIEDEQVNRLRQRGVDAMPAHSVLPGNEKPTREQLEQVVKEGGFDSLLVTRPAGKEEHVEYVPGSQVPLYGGFYDYFYGFYPMVYDPGYFTTVKTYKVVTTLYSTEGDTKLIWSATSETVDPTNRTSAVRGIEDKVVKQLEKDGLV